MLHLNQPGGPRHVREIKVDGGIETVPPADFLIDAHERGVRPTVAVAEWWAAQPAHEREAARRDGYYVG